MTLQERIAWLRESVKLTDEESKNYESLADSISKELVDPAMMLIQCYRRIAELVRQVEVARKALEHYAEPLPECVGRITDESMYARHALATLKGVRP